MTLKKIAKIIILKFFLYITSGSLDPFQEKWRSTWEQESESKSSHRFQRNKSETSLLSTQ